MFKTSTMNFCVCSRYILREAGEIFNTNPTQKVLSFPSLASMSAIGEYDPNQRNENETEQSSGKRTYDHGVESEINVFKSVQSAAQDLARKSSMKFLVFHAVKYGVTGKDEDQKWESDLDVVLLGFDEKRG
jgi:hypothetical protein